MPDPPPFHAHHLEQALFPFFLLFSNCNSADDLYPFAGESSLSGVGNAGCKRHEPVQKQGTNLLSLGSVVWHRRQAFSASGHVLPEGTTRQHNVSSVGMPSIVWQLSLSWTLIPPVCTRDFRLKPPR